MLKQLPLYIKNTNEIKEFRKNFSLKWNEHQNKFTYRKNQTNDRLDWINKNKDLLPTTRNSEQSLYYGRLFKGIYECCNYKEDGVLFEHTKDLKYNIKIRFLRGPTCRRYKLCANCAKIKANQNRAKFIKFLNQNPPLLQKNRYYMVLPVKHNILDKFEDLFKKLDTSIEKIRQSIKDARRGRTNNSIFRHMDGAVLSIEFTYSNNGWNPHMNFLFCTDYTYDLSQKGKTMFNQEISDAWRSITGDSYVMSIQKVDVKEKVYEVLKYITKFSTLPHERRLELFIKTPRFRFMRKWGILYGAPIDEKNIEDEQRKKLEVIFPTKWNEKQKKYIIDADLMYEKNKEFNEENGISELLQSITNSINNNEEGFI